MKRRMVRLMSSILLIGAALFLSGGSAVSTAGAPPVGQQALITAQQGGAVANDQAIAAERAAARPSVNLRSLTPEMRKAAAARAAERRKAAAAAGTSAQKPAAAAMAGPQALGPLAPAPVPGGTPDYFGIYPNYANSPIIQKFIDPLPGIPVAHPDITTFPGSDYYEIALQQYSQKLHTQLPATLLRGYVQLNNGTDTSACTDPILGLGTPCTTANNTVLPAVQSYLGPLIIAQKDRPVRIKFTNLLPTGLGGNLFIPVDTSVMGSGMGPNGVDMFTQNRADLHLHGGNTPWISDGTPHQWVVPAGEATPYTKGDSLQNVPDMFFDPATHSVVPAGTPLPAGATNDPGPGSSTYYYTNQQSARLMFYHDHSYGITRLNVYAGEAAGYLLQDPVEQTLVAGGTIPVPGNPAGLTVAAGTIPADQIPLVIQDKTFVDGAQAPGTNAILAQDPTWNWGSTPGTPNTGDLWFPHVYMTNQWPNNPDLSGANPMGRWDYGSWFWPPLLPNQIAHGPIASDPVNFPNVLDTPGTPNPSLVPEAFMDTPVVNGAAYPTLTVEPKAYRLRILNACNDRSVNLQLYEADPAISVAPAGLTEVKMVPAVPHTALTSPALCPPGVTNGRPTGCWPETWPTDGREGGVPDPLTAGPSFLQIGTEGGLLPAPVQIDNTPVGYNYNRRDIVVLNVQEHSLLLGPAERADAIVDFSAFAGKTLILYNDSGAPVPAFDPRNDYYTGDPDHSLTGDGTGGAPTTQPGFGPNTRTIMQIVVAGTAAPAFDPTGINTALPAAFVASQPTPIVPEAVYGSAYGKTLPNTYSLISDNSLTFTPISEVGAIPATTPTTLNLEPKAIQELFELDYGRMNATLGVELPRTNFTIQTTIPLGYNDPITEFLSDKGTQLWKITHNGVDTHAIHFHLFNVQVVNRVGWDGAIRPPDANELGWKDTVRMNPLEDIVVALQPLTQALPFPLPDSVRLMNVTVPLNAPISVTSPTSGNTTTIPNPVINFGWEYVWHCHLLGHEENDMMRPMVLMVPPPAPSNLLAAKQSADPLAVPPVPAGVNLTWTDNAASETGFTVQRSLDPAFPGGSVTTFTIPPSSPATAYNVLIPYLDTTAAALVQSYYRVQAFSDNGVSAWSNIASIVAVPIAVVTPTTLAFGNQLVNTTSAAQTVTLTNVGSAVLTINSIAITGANLSDFAQTNGCVSPLAVGGSCTFSVTFTPTAIGAKVASLAIGSDDPANPILLVNLGGVGISPIASVSPTSLTFANQLINTLSAAQVVTLTNIGTSTLNIAGITVTGTNPLDFAQTNTCGATLAPAANCTISVQFKPTAAGALAATVAIASDNAINPLLVPLAGTGTAPLAGVTPTSLNFGSQILGTQTSLAVVLSNTGTGSLLISGISIAGGTDFTQSNNCGASLAAPSGSCTIIVTFKPTLVGSRSDTLNIASNDPANPILGVSLLGTGITPIAGVSPTALTFANQLLTTTSAAQQVTLSNTGSAPLTITGIGMVGGNAGDFAQTNTCLSLLGVGLSCTIDVTFTPTVAGVRASSLQIASNDPVNPTLSVPLSGTGIVPIASIPAGSALAFGTQLVNTTSAGQSVMLSNVGTAPLLITSIGPTGGNAADFAQTNTCGASVAAGATCTITVTFTPSQMGARTSSLDILSSDPVNGTLHVPLSGTGIAPVAVLLPTSLAFGQQAINTLSLAQAAVLSNVGTAPLTIASIGITGLNAANFGQTNACGSSLAPGANCAIVVTFRPTAAASYTAALTVTGSDPFNPSVSTTLTGTGATIPTAPNNLVGTNSVLSANPPTVTLTWNDRSNNEAGFLIQRALNWGFTNSVVSFVVGPNVTTFTDTTVALATRYNYRVCAFIPGGNSAWSNTSQLTTVGQLPATPTGPVFVSSTTNSITMSWTNNATNAQGIRVLRSNTATGTPTLIATVAVPTSTFTDTGRKANTSYWYTIRAYNVYGGSPYTPVVQMTTQP